MSVSVDIRVEDTASSPIDGITIEVYDASTLASVGSAVTGSHAPGEVQLSITGSADGKAYYARAHKLATSPLASTLEYVDRKAIVVYEPVPSGVLNRFVLEQATAPYAATDSAMCRCVLKAIMPNKTPISGLPITISQAGGRPTALYSGSSGTLQSEVIAWNPSRLRTDDNGIAYVDLPRGGVYFLDIPNWIPSQLVFGVPDASSADLLDLAMPYVKSFSLASSSVAVAAGATTTVVVSSLVISNGLTKDPVSEEAYKASELIDVTSNNTNCSVVWTAEDTLTITGVTAGSSTITLSRKDWKYEGRHKRLPEPPLSGNTISVSVT